MMNLLVVQHLELELGLVHLLCGCHQIGVVLQPLAHLGHVEEVVKLHLLRRMTRHDELLV